MTNALLYAPFVILIISAILVFIIQKKAKSKLNSLKRELELYEKKLNEETDRSRKQIEYSKQQSLFEIDKKKELFENFQNSKRIEFERLLQEARSLKEEFEKGYINGREWLAKAYSEYVQMKDFELELSLILKPNPAIKAAEAVAEIRKSKGEMANRLKFLEYQLASYEEYFPDLKEFRTAILDEVINFKSDDINEDQELEPALKYGYLTKEEYKSLPTHIKFQRALNNYWLSPKSNIEIGKLYERYIGHLYEKDGWKVQFHGILKGFEDFGRDLICTKSNRVLIIQCKCWSKDKIIREKHILQLYGTTILYEIDNPEKLVNSIFYTTTALSKEAEHVAKKLGIEVKYQPLEKYPMIKCNISHQTNERIYHLPFDLQYDKVIIGDNNGEFYAETIEEAENNNFRRSYKWKGN